MGLTPILRSEQSDSELTVIGTTVISLTNAAILSRVAVTMARWLVVCSCSLMVRKTWVDSVP